MPLSQKEIRDRAVEFAHDWLSASREKAEAQTFWNEFFGVFGISRRRVASFEEPASKLGDKRGSIDLFWKGTLLIEHKSRGKNLDTAYQQALDYFPGLTEQDLPRFVLVSDFENFRLHDLDAGVESDFTLAELPDQIHLFGFISGYKPQTYRDEDPVNAQVAEQMGRLHDALLASGYSGHPLEVFLVRLMYCLFADDTGIFPKDHFEYYLQTHTDVNGLNTGAVIAQIFQMLNAPDVKRQRVDDELRQFQYVNGDLFGEALPFPSFDADMRALVLDCCRFNWSRVSPAVFGSMFQAVMSLDPAQRRNLGAHYTSEKNILKVIRGLFLDALWAEFESIKLDVRRLRQFHDKLARLRFFDPACGCGNFLVIAYREVRRLEIEVLKQLRQLSGGDAQQPTLDVASFMSRIDVDVLYGIEIEEFPARIAQVAVWLTDHQVNMQLSAEFGHTFARLPLQKAAHILHGNALRLEWATVIDKADLLKRGLTLYILGNPPFVGKQFRAAAQSEDMDIVCHALKNYGTLDYVSAWYIKAAHFIAGTTISAAFVSTNSITQGEQVGALWPYLLSQGLKLHFAHRTFKWSNEARGRAQVFCVIIGFGAFEVSNKRLYDYESPASEPVEIRARNINPYLIDAADVVITSRTTPLNNAPPIAYGSMANDGGYLLLDEADKDALLVREPRAKSFIRRLLGSQEFINGEQRWCLWLKDASPAELRALPEVRKRVEQVKTYRAASKRETTRQLAQTPSLFAEIRQPDTHYLLIPGVSSENRRYIPIGFFDPNVIATDLTRTVANATLYHFGVITSLMHMAWMRQVCGRLKSDYRYSNNLVYNNFPWPQTPTAAQRAKVEAAAQRVLDVRKQYPGSTLADLYDPNTMPKALLDAHRAVDAAVDACYATTPVSGRSRRPSFKSELERLEYLFDLYRQYTEPMTQALEPKKSRPKV